MIKILNITTKPLRADGISNCIINYFEHINSQNIKIDFACPGITDDLTNRIKQKKGCIHIIKTKRKKIMSYINELKTIIKHNKYDIVHIHGSSAILSIELIAATLAGCKHRIIHSHNTTTSHPIIDKTLRPLLYKLCTARFACGEEAGKWLFKNRNFVVIKNGNNIKKYIYNKTIREKIRKENYLNDKIVIGHVGTFNYQKNHEYLFKVFNELLNMDSKYHLVLIGDGKEKKNIENLVNKMGINKNVTLTGVVSNVNEWLQAMDIMLLPSRFEGFPMVLVEWQISGLPCIVSKNVTEKVKITNLVEFLSINEEPIVWCNKIINTKIENREKNKEKVKNEIIQAGYDIEENAKKLVEEYVKMIKG